MSEHIPSLADLPLFDDAPAVSAPSGNASAGTAAAVGAAGPPRSPAATLARGASLASAAGIPSTIRDLAAPVTPVPAGWADAGGTQLDWALVRAFRQLAAEQLTASLRDRENLDDAAQHELGRNIILELLSSHADTAMTSGAATFTADEQQALAGAVYDALFGLGRLQPLVDDPDVENIEIRGHDNVHLIYSDGRIAKGPPVADSNEELIDFVSFLAARSERAFSRSHSRLNLRLPGGQRLAASGWNTPWPLIVIRAHRLVEVDLEDLVDRDVMNVDLAAFLRAAVRARKTIVISGAQGSGKALALDTPVPTPDGWTTMGALRGGDQVFDEQGRPCTVLAAHEVQHGRACFEVEFDDGEVITADGDHLWRVTRRLDRDRRRRLAQPPTYYVDADERTALHKLADQAAEQPDRSVTVTELVREVGDQHRPLLYDEARRIGPVGHTRVSWAGGNGGQIGRDLRTYSRQQLLKGLAARRDTPRSHRPRGPQSLVLTTAEMAAAPLWAHADKTWRTRDFAVDLARPLQYSRKQQFIDPYVLGLWAGDGATACARISTADPEVLEELELAGYPCTKVRGSKYDYGVGGGLQSQLRAAGLLGDKHLPREYLQGDVEQRRSLLQGLMDSDGHCTRLSSVDSWIDKGGSCEFTSTLEVLARQVHELVSGLGYRARLRSKPVTWQGRDTGVEYTVAWTTRDPMFRLPRKLERQQLNAGGPRQRYIVDIRPVDSVPVRCITVDAPSSLFLVGRSCVPTHNTTLMRALCNEIDPSESIGTIETEFELHLHEMGDRHPRISPWEGRPGVGERGPDGRATGEITLDAILEDSLRYNLSRVIVGEARGREVGAMFKAMQTAAGSLCTTHSYSARGAIERLVGLAMEAPHITSDVAYRQAAMHIDLVVQIADVSAGGRRSRFVDEVLAVELGERGMPAFTPVYRPGPDGRAVPGTPPPWLDDLVRVGYDASAFTGRAA